MDKQITCVKTIGEINRTITIDAFDWGVYVTCKDENNFPNAKFDNRKFNYTKKYDTLEKLIERAKKYYKIV